MVQGEKRGVLRARAMGLRQRAEWLLDQFTTPATRNQVGAVIRRLDEELDRLEAETEVARLPPLRLFLPETTAWLERLFEVLRTQGRHAPPISDPWSRLDDRREAEPALADWGQRRTEATGRTAHPTAMPGEVDHRPIDVLE